MFIHKQKGRTLSNPPSFPTVRDVGSIQIFFLIHLGSGLMSLLYIELFHGLPVLDVVSLKALFPVHYFIKVDPVRKSLEKYDKHVQCLSDNTIFMFSAVEHILYNNIQLDLKNITYELILKIIYITTIESYSNKLTELGGKFVNWFVLIRVG